MKLWSMTSDISPKIKERLFRLPIINIDVLPSFVLSIRDFTRYAVDLKMDLERVTSMIGVEMFFTALMISLMRGTPCVMFIEATPAKWNVFRVICVDGSPVGCF